MVYDFAGNDSMQMECVAYVIEKAVCNRCNAVSAGTEPTIKWNIVGTKGTGVHTGVLRQEKYSQDSCILF